MAADKTNNLTAFLTDIATTIREAEGTTNPIDPQDFSDRIKELPAIVRPNVGRAETTLKVTANDTADTLKIDASNNQPTGYVTGADKTKSTTITLTASGATVTATETGGKTVSKTVGTAERAETTLVSVKNTTNNTLDFEASNDQGTGYVIGANEKATKSVSLSTNGATVTASDGTNSISTTIAPGSYSASGGVLTAGATTVAATSSGITLGTATTTKPSGKYIEVTGSGIVNRTAITKSASAGYVSTGSATVSSATSATSTPATLYYPISSNVVDTSAGDATAAQILSGKVAYVDGTKITGSMVNNGAVTKTLTTTSTSYTVPQGYHSGSGKVSIALEEKTVTPTTAAQTVTPSTGKVMSKVTVSPIALVSGSIGGSATAGKATAAIANTDSMRTVSSPSGTAGTDYFRVKATATGAAGSYTPKYTVSTAGYIGSTVTGSAQTVTVTSDSTGQTINIPKAAFTVDGRSVKVTSTGGGYVKDGTTVGTISSNYVIPSGNVNLTSSGTHNVSGKATATIAAGAITASGTASATTTVAPGTVSITKNTTSVSGKTRLDLTPTTSTSGISTYYAAVKATAASNTTGTTSSISGTASAGVSTAGYVSSGTTGSVTGTATAKTSAKDSSVYYLPIPTGGYSASATAGASVIASGSGITLGTAVSTAPTSGKYITVTGSATASGTATVSTAGYISTGSKSASDDDSATLYYPISSNIVDTSDGNASASQILSGKVAYVDGEKITGSMTNRGAVTKVLDTSTTSYAISSGYHNGSGKVSISLEEKSATPTTATQSITPSSGKVLSKVTVAAVSTQTKSATPTASSQTVSPDSGKFLSSVTVNAIPSSYVNVTNITKDSDDLTASGRTISVPAGYYPDGASKSVSSSYVIPSGTKTISSSGTTSVSGYANASVADGVISSTASFDSTTGVFTASAGVSTEGYVETTDTTSDTYSLTLKDADDLSASGRTVTVPAGYYPAQVSKSVSSSYIIPSGTKTISSSGTHDVTSYTGAKVAAGSVSVTATTIAATVGAPSYNSSTGKYDISVSGSKSIAPTVTTGYISSGTAGTVSVSGSTSLNAATLSASGSASATTTVAPGTVSIANTSASVSGKTQITTSPTTSTARISKYYIAVKATAASNNTGTTSTISGTATVGVSTAGYAPTSLTGSGSVSGTAKAKTSAKTSSTYYIPIASGSATTPTTSILATPSISLDDEGQGIVTAISQGSESITPTVTAGYISSGTAGTVSVDSRNSYQLPLTTPGYEFYKTNDGKIGAFWTCTAPGWVKTGSYSGTVNPATLDSNLKAENIANGITIFGVTGTHAQFNATTLSVTPGTNAQTFRASDSGYQGYSEVTVSGMPTGTLSVPTGKITNSTGKISISSGVSTAGYLGTNSTRSGSLQLTTQAAQTITPGTTNKTISAYRWLTGTQTIKGDSNLVAGNIKSGTTIFGVTGTYTGGGSGTTVSTGTLQLNAIPGESQIWVPRLNNDSITYGHYTSGMQSITNVILNAPFFIYMGLDSAPYIYKDTSGVTDIGSDLNDAGYYTGVLTSTSGSVRFWYDCCFDGQSKVLMADSTEKALVDIAIGDIVMTYDEITGASATNEVTALGTVKLTNITELTLEDGTVIRMNVYHPMWTEEGWKSIVGYKGMPRLTAEDKLLNNNGDYVAIKSIEEVEIEKETYYTIKVANNNNFYVNGYLAQGKDKD